MSNLMFTCRALAIAVMLMATSAGAVTLDAVDRGQFRVDGRHSATNKNTLTGFLSPNRYCAFFVFDLSGLNGTVDDAALRLELENYTSLDASQTFDLFDVSTTAADLGASYLGPFPDVAGQAIYADLGTGSLYATVTVNSTQVGSILEIPLPSTALADIEASLEGFFAVGLVLGEPFTGTEDFVRFSDEDELRTHQLVFTLTEPESEPPPSSSVPEPACPVLCVGLLVVWLSQRGLQCRASHLAPGRF